jgi:hypothetical protein
VQSSSYQERWLAQIAWHKQMRESRLLMMSRTTCGIFFYEDVTRVLSDPATFSSDTSTVFPQQGRCWSGPNISGSNYCTTTLHLHSNVS